MTRPIYAVTVLLSAAVTAWLLILVVAWDRDPWDVAVLLTIAAVWAVLWDLDRRREPSEKEAGE